MRTGLVDVSCDDRWAEQVTGAHSDSVDGSVGVEEPNGVAHIVSPSMVEGEATIDVSFNPQYNILPRHVFQAHTNRPTIAPVCEIRERSSCEAGGLGNCRAGGSEEIDGHARRTGAYSHTSPAALGI